MKKQPGKIICCDCGEAQQGTFSFACENGHVTSFNDINDVIELIATDDFCEKLFETIKLYYPDVEFSANEFFTISATGLEIHYSPNYEKLQPSDISEFAAICNRRLTRPINELDAIYRRLKEKCSSPSNSKCANCKYTKCETANEIGCILKLFEDFEGFIPQPHQGHEFGDVY